jgi:Cell wall-active antibiotics response LiaF, C-terminal
MTLLLEESNTPTLNTADEATLNTADEATLNTADEATLNTADEATPSAPTASPRWGRRILIGFGIVSAVTGAAVIAVAAPHLGDGTGDRSYHPTTFAAVDHEYSFGIGTLNVDLRDVDFPPGTHVIKVDHGIGSARVWLPADVNYDVTGDLDIGDLDLFGETNDGFGNTLDAQSDADSAVTVIVDLEVDIGYGRVSQG